MRYCTLRSENSRLDAGMAAESKEEGGGGGGHGDIAVLMIEDGCNGLAR